MNKTEFRQQAALAIIGNIENILKPGNETINRIIKDFDLDINKESDVLKAGSLLIAEIVDMVSSDIANQVCSGSNT